MNNILFNIKDAFSYNGKYLKNLLSKDFNLIESSYFNYEEDFFFGMIFKRNLKVYYKKFHGKYDAEPIKFLTFYLLLLIERNIEKKGDFFYFFGDKANIMAPNLNDDYFTLKSAITAIKTILKENNQNYSEEVLESLTLDGILYFYLNIIKSNKHYLESAREIFKKHFKEKDFLTKVLLSMTLMNHKGLIETLWILQENRVNSINLKGIDKERKNRNNPNSYFKCEIFIMSNNIQTKGTLMGLNNIDILYSIFKNREYKDYFISILKSYTVLKEWDRGIFEELLKLIEISEKAYLYNQISNDLIPKSKMKKINKV